MFEFSFFFLQWATITFLTRKRDLLFFWEKKKKKHIQDNLYRFDEWTRVRRTIWNNESWWYIYSHPYLLSGSSIKTLPDTRASGTSGGRRVALEQCFDWSWFCCANIWVQGRGSGKARSLEKQVSSGEREEDEKAAPWEELWNEMPKEGNFREIVPWEGDITIVFICPGKHL